jgi:protein-S-isoprenylcysteine O-methyltransferase Ste14
METRCGAARRLPVEWLPLCVGLIPAGIVITTYFVSATGGHVGWCCPVLDGCTSISATGRYGVSYYIFKAGMLPTATLLAAFWLLAREWLRSHGADGHGARWMAALGFASAAFLILYAVFLGSDGDVYRLLRRYGVNLHFGFGFLAQALLAAQMLEAARRTRIALPRWLAPTLISVLLLMLLIGLFSVVVANLIENRNRPQNMAAWTISLLITVYYLIVWRAWRTTGFALQVAE